MRFLLVIIMVFLSLPNAFTQEHVIFKIYENIVNKKDFEEERSDFSKKDFVFYEDEDYIITRTCHGEWGGSIWFKNKKTDSIHSCRATCPVSVNRINGKYIVSSSLAHLSGATDVIEIENPDSLSVFKLPKPRKKTGNVIHRYYGDTESKSSKGVREVWSEIGSFILTSFQYQDQLYHIVSRKEKTFLTKIEDGKLIILNIISEEKFWDYEPTTFRKTNGDLIAFFKTHRTEGYIEISNLNIKITRIKSKS